MRAGDDQAGDVRDVGEEVGADLLRDLAERLEVEQPRVGRRAADDDLRARLLRQRAHGVVVDELRLPVDRVLHGVIEPRGEVDVPAVRQVAAVGQAEPHDRVAGLEQRVVDGHVRGRARVRLDVGVVDLEQALRARDRQLLERVDVALALVVALAGVALGVLVGQDRSQRLEHRRRGVVLRRDEAHRLGLIALLRLDEREDFGIGLLEL